MPPAIRLDQAIQNRLDASKLAVRVQTPIVLQGPAVETHQLVARTSATPPVGKAALHVAPTEDAMRTKCHDIQAQRAQGFPHRFKRWAEITLVPAVQNVTPSTNRRFCYNALQGRCTL